MNSNRKRRKHEQRKTKERTVRELHLSLGYSTLKLEIGLLHPREFKEIHQLSVYQLHRLSKYPEETLKHWLASPQSARYQEPKESVKHHFGLLHLSLQSASTRHRQLNPPTYF